MHILTIEQLIQVAKLKDLSRVLADFVTVIEDSQDPKEINEAIKGIEYYQRNYFKPESIVTIK